MPDLRLFTSTIADGNLSFKWGNAASVIVHRRAFLSREKIELDQTVAVQTQDSTTIEIVTAHDAGRGMRDISTAIKADALLTQTHHLPLFLLTADCLPMVLFDRATQTLGIAHLSLKTIDQELPKQLIDKCVATFDCQPNTIEMHIGPGIHYGSYELSAWPAHYQTGWQPFVQGTSHKTWAIDLHGFVLFQLLNAGIQKNHIFLDPTNTFTSPEYFSHARSVKTNQTEGRFATVALIV